MITIKEIAEQLGMSTTTISNVIHGKTGEVSGETTERVRKFLEEVEYVPNISARNLAQNRSKIIGVVLKAWENKYDNIFQDPFVSEMIGGIEKQIRENGYFMMLYISDDIAEILKHVSTWNVDGLILFCMLDDDALRVRRKYHKPIVCIDTYVDHDADGAEEDEFVNIGLDDEQGAYDATRYLIEKGHRKIGILSDNQMGVDLARFRGYRRALKESGIEYSDRNFFHLHREEGDLRAGFEKMAEKARKFTAVFCCSDLYAVMLMNACFARGIRVPEDLSVVGFDDNLFGKLSRPGLTTIHQNAECKGSLAASILMNMLAGKEPETHRVILRHELVERESVRALGDLLPAETR